MGLLVATDAELIVRVAVWGGLAILLLILLALAAHFLRKRLYSTDGRDGSVGFDLETLRILHEEGTLSDAEYRALRANAIEVLRCGSLGRDGGAGIEATASAGRGR